MTRVTDGVRTYQFDHLLTGDVEVWAHEGGLFVLFDAGKNVQVTIDPIGMSDDEIERAMLAGDAVLARTEPAPINRKARRASGAKARTVN